MNHATTIILTIILALFATTQAATIPFGTSSGGGGGSTTSSTFTMPFEASSSAKIEGPGYRFSARSENQSARIESHWHHEDDGTSWLHEFEEPKRGITNFWGQINNGTIAGNQNFVFFDSDLDVEWNGSGSRNEYEIDFDIKILLTGNEVVNWIDPSYVSLSSNGKILGGADYHMGMDIGHDSWHQYNEETGEWEEHSTRNLRFDIWGNFEDCEIDNLRIEVDSFTRDYNDIWYDGVSFSGSFDVDIVHPNPEPATIALLALGGAFLLRRRRRS